MTGGGGSEDLYELLGVRRDAPAAEITRAYHRRARALHPDTQPGQPRESARFREVEQAYRVLHDPARRAAYDQSLRQATARPAPAPRAAAVARPPGATVWAGPVQVIPPAASPPAPSPVSTWLAALAWESGGALEREWGWPW